MQLFYFKKMLVTRQLRYRYPYAQKEFTFPDVVCEPGQAVLILGPSGCGKSTLLHLIAGLLRPDSGSIAIDNIEIQSLRSKELDAFRARNIGLVLQKPHFLKALSVYENLLLFQSLSGRPKDEHRIREILETLDLGDKKHQLPYALSQGEAQRLSLARAVMNLPKVLLADEPSSSLDDIRTGNVAELLMEQARKTNAALIVVSHDARLKELFPSKIQFL